MVPSWGWLAFIFCLMVSAVTGNIGRSSFPNGFVFGTASSAYQYEGAAREGGRGPSIWDTISHTPGMIVNGSNGDVAIDEYHRYKEDVQLMAKMGMDAYRFSISWSRIFPNGKGEINRLGVAYYNNLINELKKYGIEPYVTLYHWDLPQALQDVYGGWHSPMIVQDYVAYAETCFAAFGDRVKHWITFNEPYVFTMIDYYMGSVASARCLGGRGNCSAGNSSTEPYIVAHNVLLSHASAVDVFRKKYWAQQRGSIGITLNINWFIAMSNSVNDKEAAQRAMQFRLGWFLDPIAFGDYPKEMRTRVGSRLPKFSPKQSLQLRHSFDFVGINYYTTQYVSHVSQHSNVEDPEHDPDIHATYMRNGIPIGPRGASLWLYIYPRGIKLLLEYIMQRYQNPPIFITENGVDEYNNASLPLEEALNDTTRVNYHRQHLHFIAKTIRNGADIRGYFAWSLLDNFEWNAGYSVRFGLYFVDYKDNLKRYPKKSVHWFRKFLNR